MSETLSCRSVKKPKSAHVCDQCGKYVRQDAVRIYGGKEAYNGIPQMFWFHAACVTEFIDTSREPKVAAVVERMAL